MGERIGIIGAGRVGGALGRAWAALGHDVRFGARRPRAGQAADRVGVAEAARFGDVLVLATPWPAAKDALAACGGLAGKILIDCTNPLVMGPEGLALALGHATSGGEQVAAWAAGAATFKTLNHVGFESMGGALFAAARPCQFVAGDDAAAKPRVMALVEALGFQAIDAGPLRAARLLEPLALLWIEAARSQGRTSAFALLRR
ncbi:MAG: NAD(P)-binding domain-containing protein [Alphaproteobacteria bacterium]|nr:NAD(P)-binding domain-containing protein [Alphaproteobacteria bacterium]